MSEVRFDFVEKMYSVVRVISQAIKHQHVTNFLPERGIRP